jgi:hypothetical protein
VQVVQGGAPRRQDDVQRPGRRRLPATQPGLGRVGVQQHQRDSVADDVVHLARDPPSLGRERGGPGELLLARPGPRGHRVPLGDDRAVQPFARQPGEHPDDHGDRRVRDLVGHAHVVGDERVDLDRGDDREEPEEGVATPVGVLRDGVRDDQDGDEARQHRSLAEHRLDGETGGHEDRRGDRPRPAEHQAAGDHRECDDLQGQLVEDLVGEHHEFHLGSEAQHEGEQSVAHPHGQASPPGPQSGHGGSVGRPRPR